MFGSATARQELNICLQCQYHSLQASRSHFVSSRRIVRKFTSTPRRVESYKLDNDVRTTGGSSKPGKSYDSRKILGRPDTTSSTSQSNPLRLATPENDAFPNFHGRGVLQRDDRRYVDNRQLQDDLWNEVESSGLLSEEVQDETPISMQNEFKYPSSRHPLGISDRVDLGVDRLGEPATIIVLPERRSQKRESRKTHTSRHVNRQPKTGKKQELPTSFDNIVEALDSENQGAAGAAESMNNIETLRRAFNESIDQFEGATQAECLKLASSLQRGFTMNQLKGYKRLAISMKPPEPDRLDALSINQRYRVSRWYAGPSQWPQQALRRIDPKLAPHEKDFYAVLYSDLDSNGVPKQNSKQKLINNILNVCWGIRPKEERSQEGSVCMEIGREWLDLLLRQDEQVFYKVSEAFKVKTQVAEEYSLVRITGSYDACVDAVRTIVSTIMSAQVARIDLLATGSTKSISGVQKTFLQDLIKHPQFWPEVEDQTLCRIQPVDPATDGSHTEVDVYYLSPDAKGFGGVQRRVFQLQKLLMKGTAAWISSPIPRSTKPFLMPIANFSDMALTERHLSWYRWRDRRPANLAYADTSSISGDAGAVFDKLMDIGKSPAAKKVRTIKEEGQVRYKHWDSPPRTLTAATLGQLAHAIPEDKLQSFEKRINYEKRKHHQGVKVRPWDSLARDVFGHRRTIVPSTPHLLTLLNGSVQDESTLSNFFRILLAPKAVRGKAPIKVEKAPLLELEVGIDETKRTTNLQNARLILDRHSVDLALPRQPSDIRFSIETFMIGSSQNFDPTILKFVQESNLDVWGTKPFETPATLTLTIPKRICQAVKDERIPSLKQPSDRSTKEPGEKVSTMQIANPVSNPESRQDEEKYPSNAVASDVVDQGSCRIVSTNSDQDLPVACSGEAHTEGSTSSVDHQESAVLGEETLDDQILRDSSKTATGGSADEDTLQPGDEVEIEYVFDSLTVDSKLQSLYQGFPLSLSTIEGGQVGGKREEVRFEIPGIADDNLVGDSSNAKESSRDKKLEMARSYFVSFFSSISDLIGRLPK